MKTDIQIAQEAVLEPIVQVAGRIDIQEDDLELYGKYKAKISNEYLKNMGDKEDGKLILVTAINPTPAGEGKTTVSVGLGQALGKLGKKSIIALSHAEGHKRGIASNHGDPEHLWNQLGMGYTMDGFRQDVKAAMSGEKEDNTQDNAEVVKWYRVRKSWEDAKSQKGAYKVLKNAKFCADKNEGYSVFDWKGNAVYPVAEAEPKQETPAEKKVNYRVRVTIKNLNIRKGPGTNYDKTGKYTGIGVFTIVAESEGEGATKWGLLKSYADERNGWISLDFATKL